MMNRGNLLQLPRIAPSTNLPSHVQAVLQEAILNGALPPGERLFVDEVAAHFGVSKIPIREALKALETDGWVQSQPRRGTYVRPLSLGELRENLEMRRLLAPHSARLAAKGRSEAQLLKLGNLLAEGAGALARGDAAALACTTGSFHSTMAEAAGNKMLGAALAKLDLQLRRYLVSVQWQQRRESMAQHQAIFEAIRDQEAELAARLTLAHIDRTGSLAEAAI